MGPSSADVLSANAGAAPSGFLALLASVAAQPEDPSNRGGVPTVQGRVESETGASSHSQGTPLGTNSPPVNEANPVPPQIRLASALLQPLHLATPSSGKTASRAPCCETVPKSPSDAKATPGLTHMAIPFHQPWMALLAPNGWQESVVQIGGESKSSAPQCPDGAGNLRIENTKVDSVLAGISQGSNENTAQAQGAPAGSRMEIANNTIKDLPVTTSTLPEPGATSSVSKEPATPEATQIGIALAEAHTPAGSEAAPLAGAASSCDAPGEIQAANEFRGATASSDGPTHQSGSIANSPEVPAANPTTHGQAAGRPGAEISMLVAETAKPTNPTTPQIQGVNSANPTTPQIQGAKPANPTSAPIPAPRPVNPTAPQIQSNALQSAAHTIQALAGSAGSFPQLSRLDDQKVSPRTPVNTVTPAANPVLRQDAASNATQSVMSIATAHTPILLPLDPSQPAAPQSQTSGGARELKDSGGLSPSGDAKNHAADTAPRSSDPPAPHSSSSDQTGQGTNASLAKPTADAVKPLMPNSPQVQGVSIQGAGHSNSGPASRSDSAAPLSRGSDSPLPATTHELPASSTINTASLIQTMSETEMHVAVHSNEFGAISVRTSLSAQQVQTQITVDHDGLGSALSAHAPAVEARLGNELGVRAVVQVNHSAMSFSNGGGGSPHSGQRSYGAAPVRNETVLAPDDRGDRSPHLQTISGDPGRLDIRA